MNSDDRPTLEDQLAVSKLTDEDCMRLLTGGNPLLRMDFWLHRNCRWAWHIINWNWFNVWTGENSFWLWFRHGFREWGVPDFSEREGDDGEDD